MRPAYIHIRLTGSLTGCGINPLCHVECLQNAHDRHTRWKPFCFALQMHIKYIASNDVIHENNLFEAPPACRMRGRISFSAYNNGEPLHIYLAVAVAVEWCVLSLACWFAFNTLARNIHLFSPSVCDARVCAPPTMPPRRRCVCVHMTLLYFPSMKCDNGCWRRLLFIRPNQTDARWNLFASCVFYGSARSAHHRILSTVPGRCGFYENIRFPRRYIESSRTLLDVRVVVHIFVVVRPSPSVCTAIIELVVYHWPLCWCFRLVGAQCCHFRIAQMLWLFVIQIFFLCVFALCTQCAGRCGITIKAIKRIQFRRFFFSPFAGICEKIMRKILAKIAHFMSKRWWYDRGFHFDCWQNTIASNEMMR